MPGRNDQQITHHNLCRRCQENEGILTVRTEPLCRDCFNKYVNTKVVKRMETFRTRYSEQGKERTLLLPLSFGPCSIALLHILSQHLKRQAGHTGRTGFKLHVLHVKHDLDHVSEGKENDDDPQRFEAVKSRYPEHLYSTTTLSCIPPILQTPGSPNPPPLSHILAPLPSPTARTDTLTILLRLTASTFALQNACSAILWSDSTTRLAERTIAETAKGRGFALPHLISDGETPFGLPFYYPLRDLLSKEISSFLEYLEPSVDDLVVPREAAGQMVSAKNATIDGLMAQYFESVERDYPSIVANVVRTTGKLRGKVVAEGEERCELCELPMPGNAPERSRLCYGCIRTLPQAG